MRIWKWLGNTKRIVAESASSTLDWLGKLLGLIAALFAAFGRSVRRFLFGDPMPQALDDEEAEQVAERRAPTDDIDALERQVALELAAMKMQREAAMNGARDPEEQAWFRVVAPDGTIESYACGTAAEAKLWHEWSGDGYKVEEVLDQGRLLQLGMLASLDGAHIKGARIKRLADEIAEWREERTFGN